MEVWGVWGCGGGGGRWREEEKEKREMEREEHLGGTRAATSHMHLCVRDGIADRGGRRRLAAVERVEDDEAWWSRSEDVRVWKFDVTYAVATRRCSGWVL